MITFGQRLHHLRKHVIKKSRTDFAEMLDISKGTIEAWESDRTNISKTSTEFLEYKLKNAVRNQNLPINMDWLFNGVGEVLKKEENIVKRKQRELDENYFEYKISSFIYEPLIKKGTILTLEKTKFQSIDFPCFLGYKDQGNIFYFGVGLISKNNQPVLHYYSGSIQFLVLSPSDELYLIRNYNTQDSFENDT